MEILIFIANGLYVASYFMTDILRLRLLTVTAAGCLAAYFYFLPQPLWTVIGWNAFFICLNVFQIARELRSRRRRGIRAPDAVGRYGPAPPLAPSADRGSGVQVPARNRHRRPSHKRLVTTPR